MGGKGNDRHVKRLAANKYVNVFRKVHAYLAKPHAGRHSSASSIALITVIKEKLMIARNSREARMIIKSGSIEVNGKVVKDGKYPLGFGDMLRFVPINKFYRVGVAKNGVVAVSEMEPAEAEKQIFKVVGKYVAKGGKLMLRLHNGATISSENKVTVNDSVMLDKGKVRNVVKLEKGARCLVIKGVHASESGIIKEIKTGTATRKATVELEGDSGKTETLLDNIIVISGK